MDYILLQSTSDILNWVILLLIPLVFYFFILRPQSQRMKAQRNFVDNLAKGKEVVTSGGIYGRISKIEGNIVTLQVDTKTYLRVAISSISQELTEGDKDDKS